MASLDPPESPAVRELRRRTLYAISVVLFVLILFALLVFADL